MTQSATVQKTPNKPTRSVMQRCNMTHAKESEREMKQQEWDLDSDGMKMRDDIY